MQDIIKADSNNALANVENTNKPSYETVDGHICTVKTDDIKGKITVANAFHTAISMADKVGEILRVKDFITKDGIRSRTGEVCTQTYLICDDGTVYFTQSEGIARDAEELIHYIFTDKNGDFISPISVGFGFKVIETKLNNGNTLKSLVLEEV